MVLFLSASVGEGHTAAAQAVSSALLARRPQAQCEVVDSYRYASNVLHRVASNGYIGMVKLLPQLYKYIYDQAERATKVSAFKKWLHHYTALNLRQLVAELQPDVVVCTHAFPCGVMAEYKREFEDAPPVVGIVTERDLVEAVARGAAPAGALVTDYMGDEGSVSVGLDDSTAAELKMLAIGCRHLPVVDRERLVGMVSARDLYLMQARAHELEPSLAAGTLYRDRGDWPDEAPPDVDSES